MLLGENDMLAQCWLQNAILPCIEYIAIHPDLRCRTKFGAYRGLVHAERLLQWYNYLDDSSVAMIIVEMVRH